MARVGTSHFERSRVDMDDREKEVSRIFTGCSAAIRLRSAAYCVQGQRAFATIAIAKFAHITPSSAIYLVRFQPLSGPKCKSRLDWIVVSYMSSFMPPPHHNHCTLHDHSSSNPLSNLHAVHRHSGSVAFSILLQDGHLRWPTQNQTMAGFGFGCFCPRCLTQFEAKLMLRCTSCSSSVSHRAGPLLLSEHTSS
jgi:hypothetical protein